MSDGPAIVFSQVTKRFPIHSEAAGLKNMLLGLPRRLKRIKRNYFFALDSVSFEVCPGECFGVVGRNGSGKSTALGLMAGVLYPTKGEVLVRGRVSPLLELGAGFHPELTGMENIYLNGIILGMTRKEMRSRVADIIEFSELERYVYEPIRTYSSGMLGRLGFSIAVHVDPEILLVDEVLSVGDAAFSAKCLEKMQKFLQGGITVVLVSHNAETLEKYCNRGVLLQSGRVLAYGEMGPVLEVYQQVLEDHSPLGSGVVPENGVAK